MSEIFRYTATVTTAQSDRWGRLKPSALLGLLQEAALGHCTRLGAGTAELLKRDLLWVVARQGLEISRMPLLEETVTVETWPGPPTRAAYPRHYAVLDREGNCLATATALWLLMDAKSRTMVLPAQGGLTLPGCTRPGELPAPRSLAPMGLPLTRERRVDYSLLDINGHMSNLRYLDWMEDLLPAACHESHPLARLQITYQSEAREGDVVALHSGLEEQTLRLEGLRGEDRIFALTAQFR